RSRKVTMYGWVGSLGPSQSLTNAYYPGWLWCWAMRLPDVRVSVRRPPHRFALCDSKRFVEFRDIRKWTIDAPFGRRVHIAQQTTAQQFFAALVQPSERIAEEKTLHWSQAADLLALLILFGFLERIEAKQYSAVVRDILAETGAAVDVESWQRLIGIELLDYHRSAFLEFGSVFFSPPVGEIAGSVVLPSFVVEAVRDLVSNRRRSDVAEHNSIVDFGVFYPRNLKDRSR